RETPGFNFLPKTRPDWYTSNHSQSTLCQATLSTLERGTCLTRRPTAARRGSRSRMASLMIRIFSQSTSIHVIRITSLLLHAAAFMKQRTRERIGVRSREYLRSLEGRGRFCNIHQFLALSLQERRKVS